MNYPRFQELIELYIKMMAAENIVNLIRQEVTPLLIKIQSALNYKKELEHVIEKTKQQIAEIDIEAQNLTEKLADQSLDSAKKRLYEENISDKIGFLLQKKALIQCELLNLENQFIETDNVYRQSYVKLNTTIWFPALIHLGDTRALLNQKLMDAWKIENIDNLPNEETQKIIAEIISVKASSYLSPWQNFTEQVNSLSNNHFEYQISVRELLQTITTIMEGNVWKKPSSKIAINELQKALFSCQNLSPEIAYARLQAKATQLLKRTSSGKAPSEEITNFCEAIIKADLLALEIYRTKMSLKPLTTRHPKEIWQKEKIIPQLVESEAIFEEEKVFNKVVDLHLHSLIAQSIANEVIATTQSLINILMPLENEINLLTEEINKVQHYLDQIPLKKVALKNKYEENCAAYPNLEKQYITPHYQKDKEQLKVNKWVSQASIKSLNAALKKKNQLYHSLFLKHDPEIKRCILLSQLAGFMQQQYHFYAKQAIQLGYPNAPDYVYEGLVQELREASYLPGEIFTERLSLLMKQNFSFKMTYQTFNQRILVLAQKTNWSNLQTCEGVKEIAKILSDSNLSPKKAFESMQKKAAFYLKRSKSFFVHSQLDQTVENFYKAIFEKNIAQIERMNIEFDYPKEKEQYLKFNI